MTALPEPRALLEIDNLSVEYGAGHRRPPVRAVDGVSISIAERETLGLVGESGSGKTTLGRAIFGRTPIVGGTVRFAGQDITSASRAIRGALSSSLQIVFQDPFSSLNPARTVGQTLAETLRPHAAAGRTDVTARVASMLARVGLPGDAADRYPAQFSGGQRQRIAIARALMVSPRLIVCDEPVSALDISVQAQILNLLAELQAEFGLSYLFISHDIAVVQHVARRIAVLYRGRIMESGDAKAVLARPGHPYTAALLAAAPVPDPEVQRRKQRSPSRPAGADRALTAPYDSCFFATRCPHVVDLCLVRRPTLEAAGSTRRIACHRWRELQTPAESPETPPTDSEGDPRARSHPDVERPESRRRPPPTGGPERRALPA